MVPPQTIPAVAFLSRLIVVVQPSRSAVNSKLRTSAFVCALAGLAAMLWAAYVHHRLLFDPRYASFCDINSTVSCSEVLLSRYASAYGVQMSIAGMIFFTGVLVLLIASVLGRPALRENIPGYLFAIDRKSTR